MIRASFRYGGDIVEVIVDYNNLMFTDCSGTITTIEGLGLNKSGVIKEFPDLKDNEGWKKIAIKRLKEHMKKMNTENKKIEYIKEELIKYGYEPLVKQKAGCRSTKL